MTLPPKKTFGYQADDIGDIPPVAPTGRNNNNNNNDDYDSNNSNTERDPIFRNTEHHSLPTLEQVRTEAANILARQQYSSNRFNITTTNNSNNDNNDFSYGVPKSLSSLTSSRRRMKIWIGITTCVVALIVLISIVASSSKHNSNN